MNKRFFLQIALLMVIVGVIFYFVSPKYEYIDDQTPDLLRFNRISGVLEVCKDGEHWSRVVSKSIVKVEKPLISYEEFMQRREDSKELLGIFREASEIGKESRRKNILFLALVVILATIAFVFVKRFIKYIKHKNSGVRNE